jgi:hypothetical protein
MKWKGETALVQFLVQLSDPIGKGPLDSQRQVTHSRVKELFVGL